MSVYIKGMDMPVDCMACRIACDKENYGVIGRPPKCPLAEAPVGDLINRAEAIEAIQTAYCKPCKERGDDHNEVVCRACNFDDAMCQIDALPSADAVEAVYDTEWVAVRRDEYEDFLASAEAEGSLKAIRRQIDEHWYLDAQSAEVAPKIDHDRDWIIGCLQHDGFIHTHRFDKANQIILDALSAEAVTHGRIIDADALSEKLCETTIFIKDGEVFQRMINDAPTVSAEAVQGEWIEREDWNGDYYYDCSVCGESFVLCDGTPSMNLYHFCPNCGARMEGGDEE